MDAWEQHARWWQDEFTDGADPEYVEQIIPIVTSELGDRTQVLDIGTGEGQLAVSCAAAGVGHVTGIDPSANQLRVAVERAGGPVYARGAPRPTCRSLDATFDGVVACLVFEHIEAVDAAIAEVGACPAPGRCVPVPPEPPAAPGARQRVDRRPHPRGAVLAHRAVPRGELRRGGDRPGGAPALHPPAAVTVREHPGGPRAPRAPDAGTGPTCGFPGPGGGIPGVPVDPTTARPARASVTEEALRPAAGNADMWGCNGSRAA